LRASFASISAGTKISRILDHERDRGDLVVGLLDEPETFVCDISGVPPAACVTATTAPAECKADLIINSNVLEHVGFPRQLVSDILHAASEGGLVFLGVACGSPFGLTRIFRRLDQIGIMALTRPSLAEFIFRPAALYVRHEHRNYYTEQWLFTLMRSWAVRWLPPAIIPSREEQAVPGWYGALGPNDPLLPAHKADSASATRRLQVCS